MLIALDATPAMKEHRTGVARYIVSLTRALAGAADPGDEFLLCYRLSGFRRASHRIVPPDSRFRSRWMQGIVRPRGCRIAHGPAGRLLDLAGARSVVTVHDVFSLLETSFGPHHFRRKMAGRYREIADRADRIIFPSTWTEEQFWSHHPDVSEDRLVVVPPGVGDRFRPEARGDLGGLRNRYGLFGPYFLFVGEISRRKNVTRILDAFEGMPADGPVLVLAGRPSFGHEDIRADVSRRGLEGRVLLTGYFPDDDLPALYAGAEALVYPSLMEGFGLSVIEAQASGTPVICSTRGALDETSGGVRIAVDAEDADSIREGMLRILEDRDLAERLAMKGVEWASQFRWSRVARNTRVVYEEATA